MGSWNGTCGVSQLPIMEEDRVAIFFMKENRYREADYTGCVYSDDLYRPVSPAIFGEYNDYGRVAGIHADNRILESLFRNHAEYADISQLIDKESRNERLYIMLVHFDLYTSILSEFGERKDFFTEELSSKEFYKKDIIGLLNDKRKKDTDSSQVQRRYWSTMESLDFQHRFYRDESIYHENLNEDPLVEKLVDLLVFRDAMSLSRKLWIPQAGQGSQDYEFDMVKITNQFANEKKKKDDRS